MSDQQQSTATDGGSKTDDKHNAATTNATDDNNNGNNDNNNTSTSSTKPDDVKQTENPTESSSEPIGPVANTDAQQHAQPSEALEQHLGEQPQPLNQPPGTHDMGAFSMQDPTFQVPGDGIFPSPNLMMPSDVQTMQPLPTMEPMGMNGNAPQQAVNGTEISADEIALYDRQIRLWGLKAQRQIQGANILLITIKALANEIAKNLVLAGVGTLTLIDDQPVTEADLGSQFFLSQEHVGQNRAHVACERVQKLNPRVKVFADTESAMTKGPSYFGAFDVVIATDSSPTTLAFVNTAARLYGRKFYGAGCHGLYGYIFCDLVEHEYILRRDKSNVASKIGPETRTRSIIEIKTEKEGDKTIEMIAKRELFSTWDLASETSVLPSEYTSSKRRLKAVTPALSCLRALWGFETFNNRRPGHNRQDLEFFTKSATQCHQMLSLPPETLRSEFLRSFLQNIGSEIAAVAAILGGQLAQDVINVLGQSQQPIQNMVIFDGNKMESNVYPLHPEGNLGKAQLELTNPMPMMPMPTDMGNQQMMPMDQTAAMGEAASVLNQQPGNVDLQVVTQSQAPAPDQAAPADQANVNPEGGK